MAEPISLSIITPSFNQAGFIRQTIESVLSQEINVPVGYLVIDGGSADGTIDILKEYSGRLTWISEPDSGQSNALNKGFTRATGEIIGWLNSDDLYMPGALQKVVDHFESHPETAWLYGYCRIIDEKDQEIRKWISDYKIRHSRQFSLGRLLIENYIAQPAVFFRRESLFRAGLLDESLHYSMDYDLWIRLAMRKPPAVIHDILSSFRLHSCSKSMTNYRKAFAEQYMIHKRYDRRPLLLLRHRLQIMKILSAYWLLANLR
jgi:glycosyltransferase involved in cell wall biosynthesis